MMEREKRCPSCGESFREGGTFQTHAKYCDHEPDNEESALDPTQEHDADLSDLLEENVEASREVFDLFRQAAELNIEQMSRTAKIYRRLLEKL